MLQGKGDQLPHLLTQRDERFFIMGQGVSKFIYYVGAFMLLFVPGLNLTRGGGAWMIRAIYTPAGVSDYYLVLGSIAIASAISYLMMEPLTKLTLRFIDRMLDLAAGRAATVDG